MIPDEFLAYLKSQKWFYGVRADAALLFYSTKQEGVRRHVKDMHGIDFAETLLVPLNGQPVRVINTEQAKAFHAVSLSKIQDDPSILLTHIKENDVLWARIASECEDLDSAIKAEDEQTAIQIFKQASSSYAEAGAQFIVIFSLGLKLTELGVTEATKSILDQHDRWRNQIAFKEEAMGDRWYNFFDFMQKRHALKSSALDLMKYLTLPEVILWLEDKGVDVDQLLTQRQSQSFVYHDQVAMRRVIDEANLIAQIAEHFSLQTQEDLSSTEIKGQPAYAGDGLITGEVVVIKTKEELALKASLLPGKIIVAVQTTPHYIQHLKNVQAIITDEGGITCHAAIISRELKVPCVVGTKVATKVLHDGDKVELDVERGVVKVIKRAE